MTGIFSSSDCQHHLCNVIYLTVLTPSIKNRQYRVVFSQKHCSPGPLFSFLEWISQAEADLKEAISCVGASQPDSRLKTSVLLSISSKADKFGGEQRPLLINKYKKKNIYGRCCFNCYARKAFKSKSKKHSLSYLVNMAAPAVNITHQIVIEARSINQANCAHWFQLNGVSLFQMDEEGKGWK